MCDYLEIPTEDNGLVQGVTKSHELSAV